MGIINEVMKGFAIEGLVCLECGTGAGNMTRYLVKRGAGKVYSVSNNKAHILFARKKLSTEEKKRVEFINTDLQNLNFLGNGSIDLITAHMLLNVVSPTTLLFILKEVTRVAKKGARLVVIDYNPLSSYLSNRASIVEELFRIENAVSYLKDGEPAMVWYPSEYVAYLLQLLGWKIEGVKLVYPRTPWEKDLLGEHVEEIRAKCAKLKVMSLRKGFLHRTEQVFSLIKKDEVIFAGTIYCIKARRK